MAKFLDVYLLGQLVGELEQDDSGALWFGYDAKYLDSENALPLSASLPLREERFKRNECRPFFAGLLPEETSRTLVAKTLGVSDRNDFALLSKIGAECAGAVSLLERGMGRPLHSQRFQQLSENELEAKLQTLPQKPLLAGEKGMRLSLAGAQGKLATLMRDDHHWLALDGSPSSHILKPDSAIYPGLASNEFFCMSLAKDCGLNVAAVELRKAGSIEYLQVARYDRLMGGKEDLTRIHQEDFCQALGIVPEMKYQQEGGPSLKRCISLIREVSTIPGKDVLSFFDAVIFNFLIGNNDAHGKNFSFLYGGEGARLAPLYDLVCTQVYEGLDDEMAMKIGGTRKPAQLARSHWLAFFEEAGLNEKAAMRRMKAFKLRVASQLDFLEAEADANTPICKAIRSNLNRLSFV